MTWRVIDLFSGIGGFSLAARWAGWETVQLVEIDKYCQGVLRRNFPEVPVHADIRTFDARPFRGRVDIVVGGPPCQPHSTAGSRLGAEDPRHLWPEYARVVEEAQPRWVLAENVVGIRTTAADEILGDLESLDYTVWPVVVGAWHAGAPHRRNRVWFVAHANGAALRDPEQRLPRRWPRAVRDQGGAVPGDDGPAGPAADADVAGRQVVGEPEQGGLKGEAGRVPDRLGDGGPGPGQIECGCGYLFPAALGRYGCPDCCGDRGDAATDAGRQLVEAGRAGDGDRRRPAIEHRLVYRPDWRGWTDAPRPTFRPVAHGLPAWVARGRVSSLKALGNSVVPQLVLELYRAIELADMRREQ